jgi:FkbM family methyltransferase
VYIERGWEGGGSRGGEWGRERGVVCISPSELARLDDVVVIIMVGNFMPVYDQLSKLGLRCYIFAEVGWELMVNPCNKECFIDNKILETFDLLHDIRSKEVYYNVICNRIAPQFAECYYSGVYSNGEYFNHDCFALTNIESYVDCGAFNGDSVKKFINSVDAKFKNIFAFEIDDDNFNELLITINKENCSDMIKCIRAGVWNENTELLYGKEEKGGMQSFSIHKKENLKNSSVVKLDDYLAGEAITLIKMDIEGAELNALKGAEHIIRTQKPKLAICLYHKLNDLWEIPIYLKSLVPEYKIHVRHHTNCFYGTVLYAAARMGD